MAALEYSFIIYGTGYGTGGTGAFHRDCYLPIRCGSGSNPNPGPAFQVNPDPDPIRIQGSDDQHLKKKNTAEINFISFVDQKLQFTYVQATGEAFSPQTRTSSISKNEFY